MPQFSFSLSKKPENRLESLLKQVGKDPGKTSELNHSFHETSLYVAARIEPGRPGSYQFFYLECEGHEAVVPVFTSENLLRGYMGADASFVYLKGTELLDQLPAKKGIILNPDAAINWTLSWQDIQKMRSGRNLAPKIPSR